MDFAEISQSYGVIPYTKNGASDFGYLFPFGLSSHFSDSTLHFHGKIVFKVQLQQNGKRHQKSEKTVFVSCITP